jgi:hypothetical protein
MELDMKFDLSEGGVPYSRTEKMLFSLIPKTGKPISSVALANARQKKSDSEIFFPRNSISAAMSSLMRKIEKNKEPFRILKSPQKGPYPSEFWITEEETAKKKVAR